MQGNSENMLVKILVGVAVAVISTIVICKFDLDGKSKTIDTGSEYKDPKPSISGIYKGHCYNRTYGQKGKLILNINQHGSGTITGTINITGELFGSGDIEGHCDGRRIGFTSKEATTGMIISWDGIIDGSEISGDYTASVPPYLKAQTGLVDQVGDWEVSK